MLDDADRPSLGGGIKRGSSDVLVLNNKNYASKSVHVP
jgi:hypothetical protein